MPDAVEAAPFPNATWGETQLTFDPQAQEGAEPAWAVLVFAVHADGFVLADIPGRGWTIPSGRIEAGESPRAAAVRETLEETGCLLDELTYLGSYTFTTNGEPRVAPAYTARVLSLGPFPLESESCGVCMAALSDLPSLYHMWNPLMERMFEYASAVLAETRAGSLSLLGGPGASTDHESRSPTE